MPKRKSGWTQTAPRALGLLAVLALGLFLIAEAVRAVRSDAGRLTIARTVGLGERSDLTRIVGRQLRRGLAAVEVGRDSITETVLEHGPVPVRWRVGLRPGASLLQANAALTRVLEAQGAAVLEGRERVTAAGTQEVRLLVGLPRRPTHEVLLVRGVAEGDRPADHEPGRLAVIVYGFGDNPAEADSFFSLPAPFAVAVVTGERESDRVLALARERQREVIVHLPLEPLNYPRVNPGPGTVLVSMSPGRIGATVRQHLKRAGDPTAVANHMGSLATQDMTVMTAVYRELRRRNVAFLHLTPAPGAVCRTLAAEMGVTYAEPDAMVDREARERDTRALDRRWSEVLAQARERGHAVVLVRATPLTWRWLPGALASKRLGGVALVPLAALLEKPAAL
jgi:polysaccharide deacetylase 2 family uncharacterized protein YibQ